MENIIDHESPVAVDSTSGDDDDDNDEMTYSKQKTIYLPRFCQVTNPQIVAQPYNLIWS